MYTQKCPPPSGKFATLHDEMTTVSMEHPFNTGPPIIAESRAVRPAHIVKAPVASLDLVYFSAQR